MTKPGTRLGPYEITARIGGGGMGEVFSARDTRLDRNVAVKVLPAEYASNAQLRVRFEREAKTISQLNHPNICTLFDVGNEGGTDFLVMELLEGETLADRLARGPLPIEEVYRYGTQIAEALDKAHRQGIVHRDLKPGNVMISKGVAKLLDFGLAKPGVIVGFGAGTGPGSVAGDGATEHKPLTQEGTIVGTFQYMAPEQLEGLEADARTDIFAFGAVLYEMVTGRRAFAGSTRTSLIAAIVGGSPTPITQVVPVTPPALEHVVQRCLEKDPAERWQSAHDIAEELKWISSAGSQAGVAVPVITRRKRREKLAWALHLLTAAVAVGAAWGFLEYRKPEPPLVQTAIVPPPKVQFVFDRGAMALAPDGSRVAFLARTAEGRTALWVRPLSSPAAQALSGTEEAAHPFWSPDSRYIGFFADGKLKKIDANGGPAQTLCEAREGRGGSWSPEGLIIYTPSTTDGLYVVSDAGGVPKQLTILDTRQSVRSHRLPHFLPDGRRFLYLVQRTAAASEDEFFIHVGSLDGDVTRQIAPARAAAMYSRGYLVYLRDRSLVAQQFDPESLEVGRDLTPIAEGIARNSRFEAVFSVTPSGLLSYQSGSGAALSQLQWFAADGKPGAVLIPSNDYSGVSISPDGRKVSTAIADRESSRPDIWVIDIARVTQTRLTFDPKNDFLPLWSPSGDRILYTSGKSTLGDLMVKRSSGTGVEEVLHATPHFSIATDWSRDGKLIAYQELNAQSRTDWDLWLYSVPERKATVFLRTPFAEQQPRFSPDGRWLSYQSSESGRMQIYVQATAGTGGKWQISTEGGTSPQWSADGRTMYYVRDDKLYAVDVTVTGDEFQPSLPREVLTARFKRQPGAQYDVAPDGRFLVNTIAEDAEIEPITLVQNWTAMLAAPR